MDDHYRSEHRADRREEYLAKTFGFGLTAQGRAVARQHREHLVARIQASRGRVAVTGPFSALAPLVEPHRDADMWRTLKIAYGDADDELALDLIVAGISVAEPGSLGADKRKRKNFRDQAERIGRSLEYQGKRDMQLKIGAWGMEMLRGLPAFQLRGEILELTQSAYDLMDDVVHRSISNNPLLSPLPAPPVPWTQVETGGVPDDWATVPLVRTYLPMVKEAVRYAIGAGTMQPVLDAINALQAVPFTINKAVLGFMLSEGNPPSPAGDRPPWREQDAYKKWMAASNDVLSFNTDTAFAEPCPRFWVPLNFDFRGRVYGVPHFDFQREDRVRGLFLFDNGAPIGEEGIRWLKAHVARSANGNQWSREPRPGDLDFEERIKWTDENIDQLRGIGERILRGDYHGLKDWALPKDKYQFIAAVCELVQALDKGPSFKTRLPIMFDASASGMQHMLAIMKADTGRLVNIVDGCGPEDFYRRVAFRVYHDTAVGYVSISHWGMLLVIVGPALMNGPFDRSIIKAAAVPNFYGSKGFGMAEPVADFLRERHSEDYEERLDERVLPTFAGAIVRAINAVAPEAARLFSSIRKLAKECTSVGKPLRWTTRLGFPVINGYYEADCEIVSTKVNGRRRRVKLTVGYTKDICADDAASSAAANYIHSADALHLHMITLAAAAKGIEIVSAHDCFGTIAPHAPRLREVISDTFEELHEGNALIDSLWASAKKELRREPPPMPKIGTAKIKPNFKAFS